MEAIHHIFLSFMVFLLKCSELPWLSHLEAISLTAHPPRLTNEMAEASMG